MKINLNGSPIELNVSTIEELLIEKKLQPDSVIIEYNYSIVKKEEWSKIILKENDTLEVLRFVGGG